MLATSLVYRGSSRAARAITQRTLISETYRQANKQTKGLLVDFWSRGGRLSGTGLVMSIGKLTRVSAHSPVCTLWAVILYRMWTVLF